MAGFPEYSRYDGLGLAELLRTKQLSPLDVVEAAITRIERLNPRLNAVVCKTYERAREAAASVSVDDGGPFAGVPFLLKDLLQTWTGVPTTSGTRMLRDHLPDHDSELVKRYRRAGLNIVGKTNTPEFGITPYTESELLGPARNPWDLARTPGGSSGGSAASVAARLVPIAHGGDGGGSIRIPASCCGVFGLKPTRARTPSGPDHGENWLGCAVEHVLTRSVRDSAAVLDATAGPDAGAPYYAPPPARPFLDEVTTEPGKLRVAFTTHPFLGDSVDDECKAAVDAAAKLLSGLGHQVEEARPTIDRGEVTRAFITMLACETAAEIDDVARLVGRRATMADFESSTWLLGLLGRKVSGAEYASAMRTLRMVARTVAPFFDRYDVLVTPTLASPPVLIGALQPQGLEATALELIKRAPVGAVMRSMIGPLADKSFAFVPYTPLFNITGQPAMSLPIHWSSNGLPIGVHVVGRYAEESLLFRLAGQVERAAPWGDKAPHGFA